MLTSSDAFGIDSWASLAKEESSYLVEAKQQEERIQKFVDEGRDEYDVKQQVSWLLLPFPSLLGLVVSCTAASRADRMLLMFIRNSTALGADRHAQDAPRLPQAVAAGSRRSSQLPRKSQNTHPLIHSGTLERSERTTSMLITTPPLLATLQEGVQDDAEVQNSLEYSTAKQLLSDTQAQLDSPLPAV